MKNSQNEIKTKFPNLFFKHVNVDIYAQFTCNKDIVSAYKVYIMEASLGVFLIDESPMLGMLLYEKRNPWRKSVTTTLEQIFTMESFFHCFTDEGSLDFYKENEEICKQVKNFKAEQSLKFDIKILNDVKRLKKNDIEGFWNLILDYTFNYINILEKCLFKLFFENKHPHITFDDCKTRRNLYKMLPIDDLRTGQYYKEKNTWLKKKSGRKSNIFNPNKNIGPQYMNLLKQMKLQKRR